MLTDPSIFSFGTPFYHCSGPFSDFCAGTFHLYGLLHQRGTMVARAGLAQYIFLNLLINISRAIGQEARPVEVQV